MLSKVIRSTTVGLLLMSILMLPAGMSEDAIKEKVSEVDDLTALISAINVLNELEPNQDIDAFIEDMTAKGYLFLDTEGRHGTLSQPGVAGTLAEKRVLWFSKTICATLETVPMEMTKEQELMNPLEVQVTSRVIESAFLEVDITDPVVLHYSVEIDFS